MLLAFNDDDASGCFLLCRLFYVLSMMTISGYIYVQSCVYTQLLYEHMVQ